MKTKFSCICLTFLLIAAYAFASPVPDTGQTKCYNSTVEIPCPSPGQSFYGQDGNYTINPMSYTKLDGNGNTLFNSAESWVMVKDNVTGLIWEMKTNKDGKTDYSNPHDADNTYTWYDSNPATNGGNAGTPGNGTDTEDFIKSLNDSNFGGYSDWRMPTIKELTYIVNYSISMPGPTIDTGYFPNTQPTRYWSSTANVDQRLASYAWLVDFRLGSEDNDYYSNKGSSYYARAVRGGQSGSSGNFTDNGDGTVTDSSTGLMWQQASSSIKTWEQALTYCEGLNLGGHTDWRLPTIKELKSQTDYSRFYPAINKTYFPDTATSWYWSSTTGASHTDGAWIVDFDYGNCSYNYKYSNYYVRAVRGGQSAAPTPINPDIKANGQDGPLTVSSGTAVSITASLAPGDQNGKLADWWIAYSSPSGWYSPTSNGWLPGIYPLATSPLFYIAPVEILNGYLPVGDYAFYFAVDLSPNGLLDSPIYYDGVQVHVINPTPTPGKAIWIGNWLPVNFMTTDDKGVFHPPDITSGLGFIAEITADEWKETYTDGQYCTDVFSYAVDNNNNNYSMKGTSTTCTSPPNRLALLQLGVTGRLEFQDNNNTMIQYIDPNGYDTIVAFKWIRK